MKQGGALLSLLFNFALDYAIRRVQVNQDGLKFSVTHKLLVYTNDVNILGRSIHVIRKNTEALVVANKEAGLVVKAYKTKYIVLSQGQNAGIKIDNIVPLKGWNCSNIWKQP